jgi:hypothetical protein
MINQKSIVTTVPERIEGAGNNGSFVLDDFTFNP